MHPCIPRMLSLRLEPPVAREEPAARKSSRSGHLFTASAHQRPNHVLINEYKPGQGIMPHEDGSAYFPVVATVSLGAPIVLNIYEKDDEGAMRLDPRHRILQEPRSLLVTSDEMYRDYLHGIDGVNQDNDLNRDTIANWELLSNPDDFTKGSYQRETRTSLTFRDVLQVVKPTKLFPGLGGR